MAHSYIGQYARFSFLKEQFDSAMGYKAMLKYGQNSRVEDSFDSYALQSGNSLFSKAPDEEKMRNS